MTSLTTEMRQLLEEYSLEEDDLLRLAISDEELDRIAEGRKGVDFRPMTEEYDRLLFPHYDETEIASTLPRPYRAILYTAGEREALVDLPQVTFTDEESALYHRSTSPMIIDYTGSGEESSMADMVGDEIAEEASREGLTDGDSFFAIVLGEVLLDDDPHVAEKAERRQQHRTEGPQLEQLIDEEERPLPDAVRAMLDRHQLDPAAVLRLGTKRSHMSEIRKDKCYLAMMRPTGEFFEAICMPREEDDVWVARPYRAILFETTDDGPAEYALCSLFLPTEEEIREEGLSDEPLIIIYHGDSEGSIRRPEDALGVTLAAAVYERGLVARDDFAVIPTQDLLDVL